MADLAQRRVLIVEDDPAHLSLMAGAVRSLGAEVDEAATAGSALEVLERNPVDVVLLDVALPDLSGFELHRSIRGLSQGPRVVFVTANDLVESGVNAVLDGAANYVVKRPNYLDVVVRVVGELLEDGGPRMAPMALCGSPRSPGIIGESTAIRDVVKRIDEYGATDATVLICGETGTGKELVARALHERSQRRHGPFVAVNCAAIPESLIESELFGARKGSYTGLQSNRGGLVREADGGTLFLDEIGELAQATQAKLLRLIETSRYRQIGGTGELEANARFIAATNRDLQADSWSGQFRRDLYFRLAVLRIDIPPLRERPCDIPLLVRQFLAEFGAPQCEALIDQSGWRQVMTASWPGNVRELRHAVQRTLIHWRGGPIGRFEIDRGSDAEAQPHYSRGVSVERLRSLLASHQGRLGRVAQELGVSVRTIQRRMRDLGLASGEFRPRGRGN